MTIYQAINAVMKEIGAVGKNNKNREQNYAYRGIDDVMTALAPAMQAHGIFVVPEVLEQTREERDGKRSRLLYSIVKVKYTFYASDGSSVTAVVMGEGMDSGDKATNKAMSAAFKYALLQTFCIPTAEMIDSEQDSPEVRTQRRDVLSPEDLAAFTSDLQRAGANPQSICKRYRVNSLAELTADQANEIIRIVRGNEGNRNT